MLSREFSESELANNQKQSIQRALNEVDVRGNHQTEDKKGGSMETEHNHGGNGTSYTYPSNRLPEASSIYRSGHFIADDLRTMAADGASTRSLWTMDLDYREIHGRRYCGEYYMPNDDIEQLRMTLVHQILLHAFDDEITIVKLDNPTHVLDVGTGTGEWAITFAERYPACEVVGTDIAAIAETSSVPSNVFFEIEDAENWDRPFEHYDLIHMRWMSGAFRDWSVIYDKVFDSIKPGGWLELQDFTDSFGIFFDQLPVNSRVRSLFRDMALAAEKAGRPQHFAHMEPEMLIKAGFVDVRVEERVLPLNSAEKTTGKLWFIVCIDAMEAAFLRLLTEQMNWDPEECKATCEAASREVAGLLRDPVTASKFSVRVRALVGRKPHDVPTRASE